MIICGKGATRYFGGTIRNVQDFVNIAHGFHEMLIERSKNKSAADDVYVECCKLAFQMDSDKRDETERRLAVSLVKLTKGDFCDNDS